MLYQDIIYKKYLTSGFKQMNTASYERISKSYELNYSDLITPNLNAKILDVGCGMGHFLYYLKKQGYKNFLGVDVGIEQVEYCRENITEKVEKIESIFKFLDSRKDCYDLIVLSDVLEHFNKDKVVELLSAILSSLNRQGKLIIKTPNMSSLFAPASLYIDFTHEVGFSEVSISQILKAVGFRKVDCRAEKIYISSPIKRIIFNILRKLYLRLLRFIILLDRPGDNYPRIFSKSLIALADK